MSISLLINNATSAVAFCSFPTPLWIIANPPVSLIPISFLFVPLGILLLDFLFIISLLSSYFSPKHTPLTLQAATAKISCIPNRFSFSLLSRRYLNPLYIIFTDLRVFVIVFYEWVTSQWYNLQPGGPDKISVRASNPFQCSPETGIPNYS